MRYMSRRTQTVIATLLVCGLVAAVILQRGGIAQETEQEEAYQPPATPTSLGPAIPPELEQFANDWPAPQGNLAGTRAASASSIDSGNVGQLEVAWTFDIEASGLFGGMTAVPIVAGDTVYLQDMQGNVFALNRESGEVVWEKRYDIPTIGPNGVAIGYGMIYGTLGDTAEVFALDMASGEEVWRVDLASNPGIGIDMAPMVYDNVVYVSTVPGNSEQFYEGGQKGILYALDAGSGAPLWEFDTTTDNLWGSPVYNSGGGLWFPPSFDETGNIYFGVGNAAPWPGNADWPNASSRPGPNDYANSIVTLDTATGGIRWYHNAKPHDLFDLDFQNTPVITTLTIDGQERTVVFGSGKTGTVIAYDADTGEIFWSTAVGIHQNDNLSAIEPGRVVRVYPGSLGGVETPIAYANGTIFVPIVNRWTSYSATQAVDRQPYSESTGELVALNAADGSVKWQVDLPIMNVGGATVANDVVFTGTLDGMIRAHHTETGDELWTYQTGGGINAQPAIAGDMLIWPAAGPLIGAPEGTQAQPQVVAFRLPAGAATPAATPAMATPPTTATPEATPVADGDEAQTEVEVEMVDIDFNPNEVTIPADTDVTVTLPNNGAAVHNFNVDGHNNPSDPGIHSGDVQPGDTTTVTLNLPAGDWYYYCSVPGHEEAGMFGTIHVVEQ